MYSSDVTDQDLIACGAKDDPRITNRMIANGEPAIGTKIQNGETSIQSGSSLFMYPWMDHNCFNSLLTDSELRQK